MKPASVGLLQGGWTLGDIFVPHVAGSIIKISDATSILTFAKIVEGRG